MTDPELIEILHSKTIEIYERENLKSLRNSGDEDYILYGKNILVWHSEATKLLKKPIDHFDSIDSLLFVSDEIMYFTSQLYFFKPFLYNPLENPVSLNNKFYYPYHMSLADKRYFMFTEVIFERIYAYWGLIAKLLAASMTEKFNEHQIYFPNVVQRIKNQTSNNFLWLDKFSKNEYQELNSRRRIIVHQRGIETQFRRNHLNAGSNKDEMKILINERDSLPDYFKMHVDMTLTGFEMTLNFIAEN